MAWKRSGIIQRDRSGGNTIGWSADRESIITTRYIELSVSERFVRVHLGSREPDEKFRRSVDFSNVDGVEHGNRGAIGEIE